MSDHSLIPAYLQINQQWKLSYKNPIINFLKFWSDPGFGLVLSLISGRKLFSRLFVLTLTLLVRICLKIIIFPATFYFMLIKRPLWVFSVLFCFSFLYSRGAKRGKLSLRHPSYAVDRSIEVTVGKILLRRFSEAKWLFSKLFSFRPISAWLLIFLVVYKKKKEKKKRNTFLKMEAKQPCTKNEVFH